MYCILWNMVSWNIVVVFLCVCVCTQREDLESELEKAAHYMQFAVAAYGWPIYVYLNPLTGFCKLSGNWYVFSEPSQPQPIFSDFHFL